MIKIIAHRGMWNQSSEKNTMTAFERALNHGFGIETDFRDFNGELVISHDIPSKNAIPANAFFELCEHYAVDAPHALNVKSDGLQFLLSDYLRLWLSSQYFLFDMAVPDMLGYLKMHLNTYARISEYEPYQDFDGKVSGVWLDAFKSDWFRGSELSLICPPSKPVAIVSPELHGRNTYLDLWSWIKDVDTSQAQIFLCTDLPQQARDFFNE